IAWGGEVIGTRPGLPRCTQRHQHLSRRTELDDRLPALVAFWRAVLGDRVGHPNVAVPVDGEPVRPDEHAATEALDHLTVRAELEHRIRFRVAALVAEPGGI